MATPSNKTLPKKELELFKTLINNYETRQYRKGLKTADTILKKFPEHGETLSMKGLILNCTQKKEEAYELAKLGLKYGLRSHICWHVYGLIYRSDNNYKEASKCYLNALRIDSDNQNILRDLSWLQIQLRDISGFIASRKKMLDSRPGLRPNWVGYAVALYTGKEFSVAFDLINHYFRNTKPDELAEKYDESEFLLFQNSCLEKQGKFAEALEHLGVIESQVVDVLSFKIKSAEYLVRLGRFPEAQAAWKELALSQTENYRLHAGLQAAVLEIPSTQCDLVFGLQRLELPSTTLPLTDVQHAQLRSLYDSEPAFVKSRAVSKIRLTVARGEVLRSLLDAHCKRSIRDGVPALADDICSLIRAEDPFRPGHMQLVREPFDFKNHDITLLVMDLVSSYVCNLRAYGTFEAPVEGGVVVEQEAPIAFLWARFLHTHLLERSGELAAAENAIDECLAHTSTALDMYMKKAKLLKKTGRLIEAAEVMEHMRTLDLQDRYLNNKATKYFLRANLIPQAMDTIALFTKHDGDPQQILSDLQCSWYELELADAYSRTKQWGLALKKYDSVRKHFQLYIEDLFDFHFFSCKKTTLRAYIETLKMVDDIYAHKFFQHAAKGSIQVLLHILDSPEDVDGLGHLPAAERRKERAKLKKRRAKEEAALKATVEESSASGEDSKRKPDLDPLGESFLQKNFLDEAAQWSAALLTRAPLLDADTLALVSEVQIRRGKLVQATRALHCGLDKYPLHPALLLQFAKLVRRMRELDGAAAPALNATVAASINSEISSLLSSRGHDLAALANQYIDRVKDLRSLPHVLGAARLLIGVANHKGLGSAKSAAVQLLTEDENWLVAGRGLTVANAYQVFSFLSDELKVPGAAELFRCRASEAFPRATAFEVKQREEEGSHPEEGETA